MGYLRSRGAVRLAVMVRECPWLIIKLSKFNSLVTFCPICPINWLYCSKIDAQRLVFNFSQLINFKSNLIFYSPECTCCFGFAEWHSYRSGEVCKSLFSEIGMMVPKDSYSIPFDNEIRRTGHIYPAMVSNSLWGLCIGADTKNCKLYDI